MKGHYTDCLNPADCWCEVKRLLGVFWISVAIFVIEIAGGFFSGSLALLADAGHVLADNTAIAVAVIIAVLVKMGFRSVAKTRAVGFYINTALLFAVALWIFYEAVERLYNPRDVAGVVMIVVALFGGIGNLLQHRMLENAAPEHKHSLHRALSVHVLSDLLMSGGVVVAGVFALAAHWLYADPLVSIGIALWIFYCSVKLLREKS